MFTRMSAVLITGMIVGGCAQQIALHGMPEVADGEQSRWIYHCEVGNVAVEYANRSGRYTATIETEEDRQVLDVVEQSHGRIVATLPPLRWESQDGAKFSLREGENVLLNDCRAIAHEDRGNLHVDVKGIFGQK